MARLNSLDSLSPKRILVLEHWPLFYKVSLRTTVGQFNPGRSLCMLGETLIWERVLDTLIKKEFSNSSDKCR